MISAIIDTQNTKLSLLTYFEKRYCLTELKTETKGDNEVTSPVHYEGSGDWEKIEIDKYRGVSYWRKDGDVSVERVEDLGNAKDFVTVTFPLRLIGYVKRQDTTTDDEYSADRVANALVKQLNFKNGALKQTLKAKRVISSVTDYSTNSAEIWEEETSGTGQTDVPFKYAVISVSVEIEVLARVDCLETECEQDSDILHAFDFCSTSVQDRLTPTQVTCLTDWLCGNPDPATLQVNTTTLTTIPSGDTYDLAIHDSAGSDVGTVANPSVVADSTIRNDANDWSDTVVAEGAYTLGLQRVVDSDGSNVDTVDYKPVADGAAFTCTPCTTASLTVTVYDDAGLTTPSSSIEYGTTYYINASPTGIAPTSYTLYISNQVRGIKPITQAGATFAWTASIVCTSLNIGISATDGSRYTFGSTSITSTVGVLANTNLLVNDTSTFTPDTDAVKLTNQSDLSGNGNDATQGTVARQPLNDVTGINSLHSVQFGATSATHLESLFSIAASNSWTFVLDIATIAYKSFFWIGASYNDGGTPYMGFGMTPSGNIELYERLIGFNTISNFTFSTGTTYLVQIRRTATYIEVWVNGEVIFARNTADAGNRSTGVFFGGGFRGSFDGRIGHFEQIDRFITDEERIAQEDELTAKWGI